MSQQPISSNTNYPLMSSVSVKSKPLPTKLKTAENSPLPRSTNDSFEAKHGAETAKMASPKPTTAKEQGVPLIGTALIALASLGVGIGGVLTARHFNWFELGQKVETKTIKELPETLTKLLNVGDNPTEEQAINAVEKLKQADITVQSQLEQLKQELAEGADKLIKAQEEIGTQENRILLLESIVDTKNSALLTAQQTLKDKQAEVVRLTTDLDEKNNKPAGIKEGIRKTWNQWTGADAKLTEETEALKQQQTVLTLQCEKFQNDLIEAQQALQQKIQEHQIDLRDLIKANKQMQKALQNAGVDPNTIWNSPIQHQSPSTVLEGQIKSLAQTLKETQQLLREQADETGHANQQLDLVKTELQDVLQTGLDLQQQNEDLRMICQDFLASMEKEDDFLGLNITEANFENSTGEEFLDSVNDWEAEPMYPLTLDSDREFFESIGTGNVEQSSKALDAIVKSFNPNQTDKTFGVTCENGKRVILTVVQNPIEDEYTITEERIKRLVGQTLNPKSSTNTRGSDTVPAEALEISLPQQE